MNEATKGDRYRVITLFALSGATFGVLFAMLRLTIGGVEYGQTDIDASTPLTFLTMAVGCMIGSALSQRSGTVGWSIAIGVLLLTCLLGGAMGWLVGSGMSRHDIVIPPGRAVAVDGLVGLLFGLLILAPRWIKRAK